MNTEERSSRSKKIWLKRVQENPELLEKAREFGRKSKGRFWSVSNPERVAKQSSTMKRLWANPEWKAKHDKLGFSQHRKDSGFCKNGVVYKTTNKINGKIYIGIILNEQKRPYYLGSGYGITAAIKKYGKENFSRVIIDRSDCKQELALKERFWIKSYDSRNSKIGYNNSEGGELAAYPKNYNEEIKKKMSESRKRLMSDKNQKNIRICVQK